MTQRRFTPVEANRALPLVRRIAADVLARGRELRRLERDELGDEAAPRIGVLQAELGELFAELERLGCSWRDLGFERGLVDFPARIGGRDVLLCWKSDESHVTWYHDAQTGFAGRTPIPRELLEEVPGALPALGT
jgi:hypothetical protein